MTTVSIQKVLRPALQTNSAIRNEEYPTAATQSYLQEAVNQILRWRTKEVCSFSVPIPNIPASATGSRPRWRVAYRSSSHARYLWVHFVIARSPTIAGAPPDPYAKLLVENGAGTDIGTAEYHAGASPLASVVDTPDQFHSATVSVKSGGSIVTITPNTEYFLTFTDEDSTGRSTSRIISATVFEESLASDTDNGYLEGPVSVNGPIYDEDRGDMTTALRTAWKQNAAHLWNVSSNTDATAYTNATATGTNIIDSSALPVATSHAGVSLTLTNRSTVRRTTVPCTLWVHTKHSVGGASAGTVLLYDGAGTLVASVTGFGTTAAWESATVNLPATVDTYRVYASNNGVAGTVTVYAACLYQYEA